MAEEVGGMNVAVFAQEFTISSAAEHDIGVEFSAELGLGFGNDTGKVSDAVEFIFKGGELLFGKFLFAGFTILHGHEVVAAHGGDQEGCGFGWDFFISEIFDEIKKFAWLVSDAGKEGEVVIAVIAHEVVVSSLVGGEAAVEEFEKSFVPSHVWKVAGEWLMSMRWGVKVGAHRED